MKSLSDARIVDEGKQSLIGFRMRPFGIAALGELAEITQEILNPNLPL